MCLVAKINSSKNLKSKISVLYGNLHSSSKTVSTNCFFLSELNMFIHIPSGIKELKSVHVHIHVVMYHSGLR